MATNITADELGIDPTAKAVIDGMVSSDEIRNGGEYALILQIVRGFERGESSHWALERINTFTADPSLRARLMEATIQIINV